MRRAHASSRLRDAPRRLPAEVRLPADEGEPALSRIPGPKVRAYVFGETWRSLRRCKVHRLKVRVRAEGDKLLVEPSRKVFKLEEAVGEPVGVAVCFGDLMRVLDATHEVDLYPPRAVWFSEKVLGLGTR